MVHFIYKVITKTRCELKKIFYNIIYGGKVNFGKKVYFLKGFRLVCEGGKLEIGDSCFFNCNCSINCLSNITIGDHTIFGEGVKMYDHNHKFREKDVLILNQGFTTKPIKIGRNCWVGSNVTILQGVTIGDNVVIGANTVVCKSIPDDKLVICKQDLKIEDRIKDK